MSRGFPVLGYTTRKHLLLDLDNTTLDGAFWVAAKIMSEWSKVGDCLILRTSDKLDQVRLVYNKWGRPLVIHDRSNFHLVFDNAIGYNLSTRICHVLADLGILNEDYVRIRDFRGDMTLRVSPKARHNEIDPFPVLSDIIWNPFTTRRDGYINEYLRFKKKVELLFLSLAVPVSVTGDRRDRTDSEA